MVKSPFISELEDEYRRYLSEVRSLSPRSIENHVKLFRRFRDFLRARRGRAARRVSLSLTYAFLEECARTNARKSMRTVHWYIRSILRFLHFRRILPTDLSGRMTTVRGFFRYLLSLGAVRENVWDAFSSPKRKRFIPHVFSIAELRIILGQVWRMIDPRKLRCLHLKHAYHTMYHTTYACGLRACEVCGLKIGDVDFGLSLFTVRNTKFWKTRLVPFNSRTRELVTEYLDYFRPAIDGKATDTASAVPSSASAQGLR